MSLEHNSPIKYADLISNFSNKIKLYAKNIGVYADVVPNELKYPFTQSISIPVEDGYTPKVNWINTSKVSVVSEDTFNNQFTDVCNNFLLTEGVHSNSPITLSGTIKFITVMMCFIQSKFALVHSHLTPTTCIFYISSNTVDSEYVTDIENFKINLNDVSTLVSNVCSASIINLKSLYAINNYTLSSR